MVWLALLLAALLARWAGRRWGLGAALVTLLLFTFDPNVLAHGALATTDMGTAVFITLAAYLVWRYLARQDGGRAPGWVRYVLTGAAIGLAFASKFSGVILLPALALLWRLLSGAEKRGWQRPLLEMARWALLGTVVFLLVYRFNWAALHMDFDMQQKHQLQGHSSFLLGQANIGGWWYYFPVLFLFKTPLPLLLLLPGALALFLRRREWGQAWLWLLVGGFAAASLLSRVNIGYRYLLPILPLLFVLAGGLWYGRWRWLIGLLLLWLAAESLWLHPHYLAYFNPLVGGPANGWRIAVDSNLDWGQDLAALAAYEQAHLPQPYQAAWLGTAPLTAYGVERGRAMPLWPHGREDPLSDPFYPPLPSAGQYVISATQLYGVYLKNPARFAWFLEREPTDRIGYSLFVYDVPPTGTAVGLGLSGIGPAMIAPADYAIFQSNDVTPRWFDARASLLWPGGGSERIWTAVGEGHLPAHPLLMQFYPAPALAGQQELDGRLWQYRLYEWEESPAAGGGEGETAVFADTLALFGHQITQEENALALLSFWRVRQTPEAALKIFVHLLDKEGQLVAQHDGLDVEWSTLRPGDEFAQLHPIPLPPDLPPGAYALQIGLYRMEDEARLAEPVVVDTLFDPR